MTITEALIAEHTVFLNLFDQVERVLPGCTTAAQVRTLAGIVEGVLKSHAEAEANLAYLALDHVLADGGPLESLHHDHHEIDHRLEEARAAKTCAQARRLLAEAIAASRAHFRCEEESVFPFLESKLSFETLKALGQSRMARDLELSAA
jgi:hypothetical protein